MSDSIPQKRCSNPLCHKWLPATTDYFHRNSRTQDGLHARCKECRLEDAKRVNRKAPKIPKALHKKRGPRPKEIKCRDCGETDPTKFSMTPEGHHRVRCKPCDSKHSLERYNSDPERGISNNRQWRGDNPDYLRSYRLKREYGLTLEDYQSMFESQFGLCAICGKAPKDGKLLGVDHCHVSGVVRGLLCMQCNHLLGCVQDDPAILRKAIKYLKLHST